MQALKITLFFLSGIAYSATTFFAVYSWFYLRRKGKELSDMKYVIRHLAALLMGQNVQNNFDQIAKMRKALVKLVNAEKYDEAEKMKASIERAQELAFQALKDYKETFGDSVQEIVISNTSE